MVKKQKVILKKLCLGPLPLSLGDKKNILDWFYNTQKKEHISAPDTEDYIFSTYKKGHKKAKYKKNEFKSLLRRPKIVVFLPA